MPTSSSLEATTVIHAKPSVDGRIWIFLAGVLWSLSGVWTKSLPDSGTTIAIWRGLFAGLALSPFAIGRGPEKIGIRYLWIAIAFATMVGLYIASIKATTAANAIFLQCSATAWVVPIGWIFLNETPDRRTLWGVGLAMLGIAWIIAPELTVVDSSHLVGMIMGLASGVAYASVVVGLRSCRGDHPIWLSAWNNMAGSLILASVIALTGESILPYRTSLPGLAVFGFLQMALPYTFFCQRFTHNHARTGHFDCSGGTNFKPDLGLASAWRKAPSCNPDRWDIHDCRGGGRKCERQDEFLANPPL